MRHTPGVETVQQRLSPMLDPANEPEQIRFLRNYSNYLTPKTGLLSTDTLAGIATYLRNFILNLVILSAGLGAILLLPRVAAFLGGRAAESSGVHAQRGPASRWLWRCCSSTSISPRNCRGADSIARDSEADSPLKDPWYVKRVWVMVTIVGSLVVSALFLACWLAAHTHDLFNFFFVDEATRWHALAVLIGVPAVIALIWEIALKVADVKKEITERPTWWWRLLGTGGGRGSRARCAWSGCSGCFCRSDPMRLIRSGMRPSGLFPGLLGVFGLAVVFVIGTSGRQFEEDSREWWSRVGGILLAVGVGWVVGLGGCHLRALGRDESAGRDQRPGRGLDSDHHCGRAHRDESVHRRSRLGQAARAAGEGDAVGVRRRAAGRFVVRHPRCCSPP